MSDNHQGGCPEAQPEATPDAQPDTGARAEALDALNVTHLEILAAMVGWGGSFVRHLAEAWRRADERNDKRLREAFSDYYAEYRAIAIDERRRQLAAGSRSGA